MANDKKTSAAKAAKKAEIALRRRQVSELALRYVSQADMAESLGVSQATISSDLKAVREQWEEQAVADRRAIVRRELLSIDRLESRLWGQLAIPIITPDEVTRTATAILKCKERRSKLLGLDSPELIEVRITEEQVRAQIIELRRELGHDDPTGRPIALPG